MATQEPSESSTPSGPKPVRIAAREKRIEKRKIEMENAGNPDKASAAGGDKGVKLGHGKQQIVDSLNALDALKYDTINDVTDIRVQTDDRESRRRIVEEAKRDQRLNGLRAEAISSTSKTEELTNYWNELDEIHMPQALQAEIDKQRNSCNEIIASKDRLIRQFQQELKIKDEEYVKMLKSQAEDIEILIKRMRTQFYQLRTQYENQLDNVEQQFLKERDEMIASNQDVIESLFDQRRDMELKYMEKKQKQSQDYMDEISKMLIKDSEEYHKLKITLEKDIQTLEQQLQEMRATYQLNKEKLNYNYRVLHEQDMENRNTLKEQKRKLSRLEEQVSNSKNKYKQSNALYQQRNAELTDEYRKATKHYKDLQRKFKHFEFADNSKYEQVFNMHVNETQELVDKVLLADKIITEQQLGWRWLAPPAHLMPKPAATIATKTTVAALESKVEPAFTGQIAKSVGGGRVKTERVRRMLEMLCKEAGFLVPTKVKEKLARMNEDDQQREVLQSDAILKALNVEDKAGVEALLKYFFESDIDEDDFEDELEALGDLGIKVQPHQVVEVIHKYYTAKQKMQRMEVDTHAAARKDEGNDKEGLTLQQRVDNGSREFWQTLSGVVPDHTVRMWGQLESALQEYNDILEGRAECIGEVQSLRQQNQELKKLLNQYLHAEVNSQLRVPPTQTIRLEEGSL